MYGVVLSRFFGNRFLLAALVIGSTPVGAITPGSHATPLGKVNRKSVSHTNPSQPIPVDILEAVAFPLSDRVDTSQFDQRLCVGKVVFRTTGNRLAEQTGAIRVSERESRVVYPALTGSLLRMLGNDPGGLRPGVTTCWFLLQGESPAEIIVEMGGTASSATVNVVPVRPLRARAALNQWWQHYNLQMQSQMQAADYPPLAEVYLTSMLGARLGLHPTLLNQIANPEKSELQKTFDLLFDVEQVRLDAIRQMMGAGSFTRAPGEPPTAHLPLPPTVDWAATPFNIPADGVDIETLAHHTPEECFYVRFGSWANYLWLKRLLEEHGNEIGQLIALRGHQVHSDTKMTDQLALESSALDDLLGGNLIDDVGLIGRDFYVDAGPAIGVMFVSKNGLFKSNLDSRRDRYARQHAEEDVVLETVEIAGQPVSYLHAPDNSIRSFFASYDNVHLVTTSRDMARRFLEASQGIRSLASNPEFRLARRLYPIERGDTVFAYLSRPFLHQILSPQFQIELARRNQALTAIQLLQMAGWAADNESFQTSSIDELQRLGFLPPHFAQQADGSSISSVAGQWIDSRRGRRGYFTPICDMPTTNVSPQEASWLQSRLRAFDEELGSLHPIVVGLRRYQLAADLERVAIDARIAPFGGKLWDLLADFLGPPMNTRITSSPGDIVHLQASLRSIGLLGPNDNRPPHQMFIGIQGDVPVEMPLTDRGFFETIRYLKSIPGYAGAWPAPGYLNLLPAFSNQSDADGFSYSRLLDLWRMQLGNFSVIGFDRSRLEAIRPFLGVAPAQQPAQVTLAIGDIANSAIRGWVTTGAYERAWQTSIANVRFLNMLSNQFGLPDDVALVAAEELLDVHLICPLGGEFEWKPTGPGGGYWHSTAWPNFENPAIPSDFGAPILNWFRGAELSAYQLQTQFVINGFLDLQREKGAVASIELPSFNLFEGFNKIEEIVPADELDSDPAPTAPPDDERETEELPPPPADPPPSLTPPRRKGGDG